MTTTLPTILVNRLITQLETLNLSVYFEIQVDDTDQTAYMYSIFRQNEIFQKFIITKTPRVDCYSTAILLDPDIVSFYSVHYGADGTLILDDLTSNIVPAQINIIRSIIQFFWRSKAYSTTFLIPAIDRLREIKQSLCGIFSFATPFAYVLSGKILFVFVYVREFFCPLYISVLDHEKLESQALVVWDWADGTLIGKFNDQLFYVWNDLYFYMVNQYPNLYYSTTKPQEYIPGGKDAFVIEVDTSDVEIPRLITKGTLAAPLHKQQNILQGQVIAYINLKEFVQIGLVDDRIYYLVSFTNYTFPNIPDQPSNFPTFATVGFADFRNTNYPLVNETALVIFVPLKDDSFTNFKNILYFKYDDSIQVLYVWEDTFESFIYFETGNMVIQDLRSYPINVTTSFHNESNIFSPSYINSRTLLQNPISSSGNRSCKDSNLGPHG